VDAIWNHPNEMRTLIFRACYVCYRYRSEKTIPVSLVAPINTIKYGI
jgi:hypothetical protein